MMVSWWGGPWFVALIMAILSLVREWKGEVLVGL